jgi:hypothetical protein
LNLKILGRVPPNGRLQHMLPNGRIAVDDNRSWWNPVRRYMYKDGRSQTVRDIRAIFLTAHEIVSSLTSSKHLDMIGGRPVSPDDFTRVQSQGAFMHAALVSAIGGIRNLKVTYGTDSSTAEDLDLLLNKLQLLVDRLHGKVAFRVSVARLEGASASGSFHLLEDAMSASGEIATIPVTDSDGTSLAIPIPQPRQAVQNDEPWQSYPNS